MPNDLPQKLHQFYQSAGTSRRELAALLGISESTVLRWETGTSRPSPRVAAQLHKVGLTDIKADDTKLRFTPRLLWSSPPFSTDEVPDQVSIGPKKYSIELAPYVRNGPADQLEFFNALIDLQSVTCFRGGESTYAKRLSIISRVRELAVTTAQAQLEGSKPSATHWNPNYGPHGWHRYVGRFPPHLVRALLNHFGMRKGRLVCDPFCGSGTTLVEARLLGLKGLGIEICPLSALISRTKSQFPTGLTALKELVAHLRYFYMGRWTEFLGSRAPSSLCPDELLVRPGNRIPPFPNLEKWLIPEAFLGVSIVLEFACSLNGYLRDAVCCALSACMRSIGNVDVDVVRAEYRRTPRENVDVLKLVSRALTSMIADIESTLWSHRGLLSSPEDIEVVEGNVLTRDLPDGDIDCILTSPPYGVEVISYLRTHLLSYRCLHSIFQRDPYVIDNGFIGSEYLNKISETSAITMVPKNYSPTFKRFFERRSSTSKPQAQRAAMMMRFFVDMVELAELFSKWLVRGGHLAFVIGNKKLGTKVIPTDTIITEIFRAFGLRLDRSIRHKLKCNNSNSEVPWQERTIQDEYVLLFTKDF